MTRWTLALFCLAGCGARSELGLLEAAPGPLQVKSLALGDIHSCALLSDLTAACWGDDSFGELGDVATGPDHLVPIPLQGAAGIVDLAAGGDTTCAVLDDGTLECWGISLPGDVPPVVIGGSFSAASIGGPTEWGLHPDGVIKVWGLHPDGTVTAWDVSTGLETPVNDLHDAVAISAGNSLACALRLGGRVSCWGSGPLGDGTTNDSQTPVDVVGLGGPVRQIAVASVYACALLEDGTVACWGSWEGSLGLAHLTASSGLTAAPVLGLASVKRISAYSWQSCAVLEDGTVQHWGTDYNPGIGSLTPKPVPGLSPAVDVASGQFHNCALLANGRVECWGENYHGQLGDGTESPSGGSPFTQVSETPVTVIGLP